MTFSMETNLNDALYKYTLYIHKDDLFEFYTRHMQRRNFPLLHQCTRTKSQNENENFFRLFDNYIKKKPGKCPNIYEFHCPSTATDLHFGKTLAKKITFSYSDSG